MKSPLRVAAIVMMVPLVLTLLAACTPTIALQPAADATNPACANVIVRLPSAVGTWSIDQTDAQATGAWGNPAVALLRCGVADPGPTTDLCYTVKGIDWIEDSSKKPTYVYTTFGRKPAIQVVINSKATNGQGTIILDELADAVSQIPHVKNKKRSCTDVLGSQDLPTPSPTPTP
jgi:hypothetical protein